MVMRSMGSAGWGTGQAVTVAQVRLSQRKAAGMKSPHPGLPEPSATLPGSAHRVTTSDSGHHMCGSHPRLSALAGLVTLTPALTQDGGTSTASHRQVEMHCHGSLSCGKMCSDLTPTSGRAGGILPLRPEKRPPTLTGAPRSLAGSLARSWGGPCAILAGEPRTREPSGAACLLLDGAA